MNREEAINVVKCNWPEGRHQLSEALRTLIPELQESEDERIRREMIEYFHGCIQRNKKSGFRVEQIKGWIAYIERQKEYIEDIRQYAYNKGLVDAEEKHKPAEWSEEDERNIDTLISVICVHYTDYDLVRDDYPINARGLVAWLKSLRPQPHWKPSEEHLQGLRRAIIKAEKGSDAWNSLTDLYEHLKNL